MATQREGALRYVGELSVGWTWEERAELARRLPALVRPKPIVPCRKQAVWLDVADVGVRGCRAGRPRRREQRRRPCALRPPGGWGWGSAGRMLMSESQSESQVRLSEEWTAAKSRLLHNTFSGYPSNMTDALLELESSSTAGTGSEYDEWVSNTGERDRCRFASLSNFDLQVHARLRHVAALKHNWDAEEARPIGMDILAAAREFATALPIDLKEIAGIPAVVPMARGPERGGNVQFEWDDGDRALELEVEDPRTIHYLKWDSAKGVEEEDFFSIDDLDRAVSLIRWFVGG